MVSQLSDAELMRLVDIIRQQIRSYRRGRRSEQIPQGSISNVQGAIQEAVFRTKFRQDGLDIANTMRSQPPQDRNILSVGPVRIVDRARTPGMRRGQDGNITPSLNEITDGLIFSEITYQTPQGVRNGIILYCQSSVKSATNLMQLVRSYRARSRGTGQQYEVSPQTSREQRRFRNQELIIEIPGRTSPEDPEGFSGSRSIRLSPDQIFFHSSFTVFTSTPRDVAVTPDFRQARRDLSEQLGIRIIHVRLPDSQVQYTAAARQLLELATDVQARDPSVSRIQQASD
jgi:hypothetical protein